MFFPNPKNKSFPARVIPVNASIDNFPKGNTLICNVTSATLIGQFGSQSVRVYPQKTANLKPPTNKFGAYPVAIDCILPGEKKRTTITRSNWQHNPKVRQIIFVVPSAGYKTPRLWSVLDRGEKPKNIVTKDDSSLKLTSF